MVRQKFGHEVEARRGGGKNSPVYKKPTSPRLAQKSSPLNPDRKLDLKGIDRIIAFNPHTRNQSPPVSSSGYRGGYRGSSGGGGGRPPQTSTPSTPKTFPDSGTDLDAARQERLDAALKAIGSQFDSQEGDLKAQILDLVNQFDVGQARNQRDTEWAIEDINNQAAERGIFHSGLNAQRLARGVSPLADQMADLIGQFGPGELGGLTPEELLAMPVDELAAFMEGDGIGSGIRSLLSALLFLGQQEEAARSNATMESERDELDMQTLIEMIQAGLT